MSIPIPEVLVAADIEASLISFFGEAMPLLPWSTRVPQERPDEFGRVARIGGTRSKLILDSPMVGFWLWAETGPRASELAREAEGYVFATQGMALPGGAFVYRVAPIAGVQTTEDVDSKTPMAVFTVQMTWRLTRR